LRDFLLLHDSKGCLEGMAVLGLCQAAKAFEDMLKNKAFKSPVQEAKLPSTMISKDEMNRKDCCFAKFRT
jgi:hypothetical protein